jgi:hypothetical protein
MPLTAQQKRFFHAFGYLAFPGALRDRIAGITAAFEALWADRGGGHHGRRHDGEQRSCLLPFIDQSELLSALLDDPLIVAIGSELLGADFNYVGSDGNFYVGDSGWHSDGWHPELTSIKLAIYLDPLTRDTGALRVIPGSHRTGEPYAEQLQAAQGRWEEALGAAGRDLPCVALETAPGDLLVFNQNLKHASFGGDARRRMFTINLSPRYPEAKLPELRELIAAHARFWTESAYGPAMLATATPQRMVHLEQVLANQGHLPDLARRARESMAEPSRS